jgi:outer membrane protein insertion porin family
MAAGIGLSWLSPLGPISIDWAEPFIKNTEDETENFRINFGTRF